MRAWVACAVVACGAASPANEPPLRIPSIEAPRATSPDTIVVHEDPPFRLPHTFEPTRYLLRLALAETTFDGRVEIEGDLAQPAPLLWLHGVDLTVIRAQARRGAQSIELHFTAPRADQVIGLMPDQPLPAGPWTLVIDYRGPIRDLAPQIEDPTYGVKADAWATGVFRRVIDGRQYVYTQGEAIYARQIVPCIDEPDRKVPWQLTLEVARDAVAASNAPIVRETPLDHDRKRVEFAATRPLSSYLLAFAVGPFDVIDGGRAKSGVPIRVLAPRGHGRTLAWAASEAARIMDFLEDWFAIPYAYGKLDLVAAPHAGWGAMENPGLIIVDDAHFDGQVIAHELAHQWFGDLVTMQWWDDIWLNESFAQWMTPKALGARDDRVALREEALPRISATNVHQSVRSTKSLDRGQFADYQALGKGAAVLDLLESYVGEDAFREALRDYIAKHRDGLVTTTDLADAVDRAAGKPVALAQLVDHELPVVEPALDCDRSGARMRVGKLPWPTTVCVAYDRDGKRAENCAEINDDVSAVALPGHRCPRWVMPAAGLYRVEWAPPFVKNLLANGWPALTRDERRLLFAEQEQTDLALQMVVLLAADPDALAETATFLDDASRWVPDDLRPQFDAWIEARFGDRARSLHFASNAALASRAMWNDVAMVDLVAATGDARLANEAVSLVGKELSADSPFARVVFALAARRDASVRARLLDELFKSARDPGSLAWAIAHAMSADPTIVDIVGGSGSRLDHFHSYLRTVLFERVCTPAQASKLHELAKSSRWLGESADAADRCIAVKAKLDPIFRAWLAPRRAKP